MMLTTFSESAGYLPWFYFGVFILTQVALGAAAYVKIKHEIGTFQKSLTDLSTTVSAQSVDMKAQIAATSATFSTALAREAETSASRHAEIKQQILAIDDRLRANEIHQARVEGTLASVKN